MYSIVVVQIFFYLMQCFVISNPGYVCKDKTHGIISEDKYESRYCTRDLIVKCVENNVSMSWSKVEEKYLLDHYGIKIRDKSSGELLTEETNIRENLTNTSVVMSRTAEEMLVTLDTYLNDRGKWRIHTYTEKACRLERRIKRSVTPVGDEPIDIKVVLIGSDIEGSTASLFCQVNGCVPVCNSFSWYKDRSLLVGYRVSESTLRFSRLQRIDAGQYICRVSDSRNVPAISTSFSLDVKYGPKTVQLTTSSTKYEVGNLLNSYEINPLELQAEICYCHSVLSILFADGPRNVVIHGVEEKTFFLGEIKRISCSADCNPPCNYTIKRGNAVVSYVSSYNIGRVEDYGEGYYTCIASNRISTSESGSQYLTVFEKPRRPTITQSQRYVNENDSITWTCNASCKPSCQYVWYDYQLKTIISNRNQLKFTRVSRKNHNKVFRCSAYNDYGLNAENETLIVRYGQINIHPAGAPYSIREGDSLPEITCSSDCSPKCWSLYLYHTLGGRPKWVTGNYPWKGQAQLSSAGDYFCIAYYRYQNDSMYTDRTEVVRSSRLKISITYNKLTIYPSNQTLIVKEYGTLHTLKCVLDCNPPCSNLEVHKNGIIFKLLQTTTPVFANNLLTRNDSGTYQCIAKTYDQKGLYSDIRKVDVQYGPKLTLLSASTQTVKEGSNVSLRFSIEANPNAHVYVERTRAGYFNQTLGIYAFKNISCELTGRHKLKANNSVGEDAEDFILQVLCAPRILGLQKKYDFERKIINSSVMKSYKVCGYPPPKATWKFKKKNIKQITLRVGEKDTGVELYSNGSYCHIVIDDIQEKHFGVYSIILTNSKGSLEMNFELSPEGPPLPPSDVAVQCATPEQAKLIWRPQFQGGSPQKFKIYLRTNGTWDVLEENITDVRDIHGKIIKTVDRLSPDVLHEFRVVAINDDMDEVIGSNEANCTVLGYPSQSSKDDLFSGIIGEVVGLVVVVILIASLLIVSIKLLKKRNNQETDGSGMRKNALYGMTAVAPTSSEENNVYSTANSTCTSQPAEQADGQKPVNAVAGQLPSPSTQVDEGNAYAVANYPTGDTDNVYSVTKTMAKKQEGDKPRDGGNIYSVANYVQEKGNEKQEQVYAEVNKGKKSTATKPKKITKGGKPSPFPKPFWTGSKPSRMKNKDGLIYVEVDVKKLSKARKGYIVGAENKTEYEEIDFTKHADPLPDTPPETSSETEEK